MRNILNYTPAAGMSTMQRDNAGTGAGEMQPQMPTINPWTSAPGNVGHFQQFKPPSTSSSRSAKPRTQNTTIRLNPMSGNVSTFYTDSTRGPMTQRNSHSLFFGSFPIDVCPNLFSSYVVAHTPTR